MKIIAYDHFRPGMTADTIEPQLLREEMTNVWRLWKAGVIRELYGRADARSAVIVFECGSVDEVKHYVDDFPLSKAGFLAWNYLALTAPLPLAAVFDATLEM